MKQDFHAKIFTGNLAAILAFPAHDKIEKQTKGRKAAYKLNFTQALSKMKDAAILLFARPESKIKEYLFHLLELFCANIEIIRQNRRNPHNFRKSKRIYPAAYKTPR